MAPPRGRTVSCRARLKILQLTFAFTSHDVILMRLNRGFLRKLIKMKIFIASFH